METVDSSGGQDGSPVTRDIAFVHSEYVQVTCKSVRNPPSPAVISSYGFITSRTTRVSIFSCELSAIHPVYDGLLPPHQSELPPPPFHQIVGFDSHQPRLSHNPDVFSHSIIFEPELVSQHLLIHKTALPYTIMKRLLLLFLAQ